MMNLPPSPYVDEFKKRPLSITSTTSSGSYNSNSLRQCRKKFAQGYLENKRNPTQSHDNLNASLHQKCRLSVSSSDPTLSKVSAKVMESVPHSCNSLSEGSVENQSLFCSDKLSSSTEMGDCKLDQVQRIVDEMLATEESYIKEIHDIIQGYMIPLSEYSKEIPPGIFGNISDLYKFNSELLENLKLCRSVVGVCRLFVEKSVDFLLYSLYCQNYPKSVEQIKLCMSDPSTAERFRVLQTKLNHKLNLASYLLKPVQRISKYHLFFQNILRTCDEGDEKVVQEALHCMAGVLRQINQTQHDSFLFRSFREEVVKQTRPADMGELLMKEKLLVDGLSNQKSHLQIFLFSKAVLIALKKNKNKSLVKVIFKAREATVVEDVSAEHPLTFFLISATDPHLPFKFEAVDSEQKVRWCRQMKKVLACERVKNDVALISRLRSALIESDRKIAASMNVGSKQTTKSAESPRVQSSLDETHMTFEQLRLKDVSSDSRDIVSSRVSDDASRGENSNGIYRTPPESPVHADETHRILPALDVLKRASLPSNVSAKEMNRLGMRGSFRSSSKSSFHHFGGGSKKMSSRKKPSSVKDVAPDAVASPHNSSYLFTLKIPKSKDGLKEKLSLGYKEAKCKDVVLEGCSGVYRKLPESDWAPVDLSPAGKFSGRQPTSDETCSWEVLDFYYEDRLLNDLEDGSFGCNNEDNECFSIRSEGPCSAARQDQVLFINTSQSPFISGPA